MNQIAAFFAFEVSQGNGVSNADIIGIVTIADRPLEPPEEGESESSG